jgi:hypothetical protein
MEEKNKNVELTAEELSKEALEELSNGKGEDDE